MTKRVLVVLLLSAEIIRSPFHIEPKWENKAEENSSNGSPDVTLDSLLRRQGNKLCSAKDLSEEKSAGIVDENQKDDTNEPKLAIVDQFVYNSLVVDEHHC